MKKSKEYSEEIIAVYVDANEEAAINFSRVIVLKELIEECSVIEKQRNIQSYSGILSTLKEQNIKWNSICVRVNKQVNILNTRWFLDYIEKYMTMIYPNLIKIL